MKFYDSKKFIEFLQNARETIQEGFSTGKYPPNEVRIFLGVIDELQSVAEKAVSENDWKKLFSEYKEDIYKYYELLLLLVEILWMNSSFYPMHN